MPDPFGAEFWTQVKESTKLKIPRPRIDKELSKDDVRELQRKYDRADQLLTMMPPASFDGAWYGVVRVHLRAQSGTVLRSGVVICLVCKEQLIECTDEDMVIGWEYNGVEFRVGNDLDDTINYLERRMTERARATADEEF